MPPCQNGTYTVRQLAELSGVSVRTLHHYDDVGLVRPMRAANNYRRYGPAEVARLQQVLLYREAGMSLPSIKSLLDDPSFDARDALKGHLADLRSQRERIDGLIASVQETLASLEREEGMDDEKRFQAFKRNLVEENERRYGKEARRRYGDEAVDAGNARLFGMSKGQWERTQAIEQAMAEALIAGMAAGDPAGEDALRAADLHRRWLCAFWKEGAYSKDAHRGLAQLYRCDERFKEHYEAMAPGATEFLCAAIEAYCA